MFDRWSKSVEHCQLDCMLPGFTQLMWQCQKTTSPCSLGVPECGLHPAVLPSSHPPPRSAFLDHSSSCLLQHYCTTKLERGGMLYDMSHINRLRGGAAVLVCTRTHILSYCTLLSMQLPLPHILTSSHTDTLTHTHTQNAADPLWWLWQPFVRSKRFRSKQNQSPPPSSAAESSGAHSVPASLFKSGLKRRADLHSTFTFGGKKKLQKNLVNLGWESARLNML